MGISLLLNSIGIFSFLLFYRKGHLASLMIRPTVARKEQLTVMTDKNIRECFISERVPPP